MKRDSAGIFLLIDDAEACRSAFEETRKLINQCVTFPLKVKLILVFHNSEKRKKKYISMNFIFSGVSKFLGKIYKEFALFDQYNSQTRFWDYFIVYENILFHFYMKFYLWNFLKHLTILFFTIVLHSYIYNICHDTEILKDIINYYSLAAQIQTVIAFKMYNACCFVLRSLETYLILSLNYFRTSFSLLCSTETNYSFAQAYEVTQKYHTQSETFTANPFVSTKPK